MHKLYFVIETSLELNHNYYSLLNYKQYKFKNIQFFITKNEITTTGNV